MKVIHLKHKDINKSRWDEIISSSPSGNIYAYSWYLDAVCPGWEALVCKDYSMIMPLTGNKKYGFHYLFRPLLSQQLGIYSKLETTPFRTELLLGAIPNKYRLIQYCMNQHNSPENSFDTVYHSSYELNLNREFKELSSGYSDNHKRNIRKAKGFGSVLKDEVSVEELFILMLKDDSPGSKILLEPKNRIQLERLFRAMKENQACRIIGMENREGKLIAAVLWGYARNTWYYLVPVSNAEGKEKRAHFIIIDHHIRRNSGKNEIIDFEGSDIPGLARFYSGFGAKEIKYPEIRKNNLPWPIKYLK